MIQSQAMYIRIHLKTCADNLHLLARKTNKETNSHTVCFRDNLAYTSMYSCRRLRIRLHRENKTKAQN